MPANPKYLLKSKWQKFAKLSAALLGSFLVTASLHAFMAAYAQPAIILKSAQFSFFIIWVGLMFVPYLINNGWKSWLVFLGLTILFTTLMWLRLPL